MLFFWQREVKNVYLLKGGNKVTKIVEVLEFDFTENKYKLKSMKFHSYPYLEGGGKSD
jgi:hypothetical protein